MDMRPRAGSGLAGSELWPSERSLRVSTHPRHARRHGKAFVAAVDTSGIDDVFGPLGACAAAQTGGRAWGYVAPTLDLR